MKPFLPLAQCFAVAALWISLSTAMSFSPPSNLPVLMEQKTDKVVLRVYEVEKGVVFSVLSALLDQGAAPSELPVVISLGNTNRPWKNSEVDDFLQGFASSTGSTWKKMDMASLDAAMRYVSDPASLGPEHFSTWSKVSGVSAAVLLQSWTNAVSQPFAQEETAAIQKMLESQSGVWISSDSKAVALWSPDGKSVGVGVLPGNPSPQ